MGAGLRLCEIQSQCLSHGSTGAAQWPGISSSFQPLPQGAVTAPAAIDHDLHPGMMNLMGHWFLPAPSSPVISLTSLTHEIHRDAVEIHGIPMSDLCWLDLNKVS